MRIRGFLVAAAVAAVVVVDAADVLTVVATDTDTDTATATDQYYLSRLIHWQIHWISELVARHLVKMYY
jgi:hypothetical protein